MAGEDIEIDPEQEVDKIIHAHAKDALHLVPPIFSKIDQPQEYLFKQVKDHPPSDFLQNHKPKSTPHLESSPLNPQPPIHNSQPSTLTQVPILSEAGAGGGAAPGAAASGGGGGGASAIRAMMQQSSLKIAHSDSRVPTEASPTLLHDRQFMAHTEEARCAPCPLPCLLSSALKQFSNVHDHSGWVYHS